MLKEINKIYTDNFLEGEVSLTIEEEKEIRDVSAFIFMVDVHPLLCRNEYFVLICMLPTIYQLSKNSFGATGIIKKKRTDVIEIFKHGSFLTLEFYGHFNKIEVFENKMTIELEISYIKKIE